MKNNLSELGGNPERIIPSQETDLAWLGGIIDGEGTISLYAHKSGSRSRLYGITVVNTDMGIMRKVSEIYRDNGIGVKINLKTTSYRYYAGSHKSTKPCYEVIVRRRDDLQNFLPKVIPYLFGVKREKAQNLLSYLVENPRIKRKLFFCKYCGNKITSRAKEFCSQSCWHLHATGFNNPNWRHGVYVSGVETERKAPVMDEATVRSLQECKEGGRNDRPQLN